MNITGLEDIGCLPVRSIGGSQIIGDTTVVGIDSTQDIGSANNEDQYIRSIR
jgi:hypothetical protein